MARPRSVDGPVKARILELQKSGLGVNAIARQLKRENLPGSASQVSGVLRVARDNANAGQGAPAAPRPPPQPPAPAGASTPPEDASAGHGEPGLPPAPDVGAALGHLAAVDQIRSQLLRRRRAIADRTDREIDATEPNFRLFRDLVAAERLTTEQIEALHVPVERRPEDDPANVEQARIVVATLRARVEAGRTARAGAAS